MQTLLKYLPIIAGVVGLSYFFFQSANRSDSLIAKRPVTEVSSIPYDFARIPSNEDMQTLLNEILALKLDAKFVEIIRKVQKHFIRCFIENNCQSDDKISDVIWTLKALMIMGQAYNSKNSPDTTQISVVTRAKLFSLYEMVDAAYTAMQLVGFGKKETDLVVARISQLFDWEETVFMFTHKNTHLLFDHWLQHLFSSSSSLLVKDLINSLQCCQSRCKNELNRKCAEMSEAGKGTKVDIGQLLFEPADIAWKNAIGFLLYYLDYFMLIVRKYPKFAVTFNSNNQLLVYCDRCQSQHYLDGCVECLLTIELSNYFQHFKKAFSSINQQYSQQFELDLKSYENSPMRQLILRVEAIIYPLNYCIGNFQKVSVACYSRFYQVAPYLIFQHAFESTASVSSFERAIEISEAVYSTLLHSEYFQLTALQRSDIKSLKRTPSHFTSLIANIRNPFGKFFGSYCLTMVRKGLFDFVMIFRFYSQAACKFQEFIENCPNFHASDKSTCQICLDSNCDGITIVRPLCNCKGFTFHSHCYAKFMLHQHFHCQRCRQHFVSEETLMQYLTNFDLSLADSLDFNVLADEQQEPISILEKLKTGIQNYINNVLVCCAMDESEDFVSFFQQYYIAPEKVSQCCINQFNEVIDCIEGFFQVKSTDAKDSLASLFWEPFKETWWNSIKEEIRERFPEYLQSIQWRPMHLF